MLNIGHLTSPKVKVPGGAYRPTEPPSIFGQTKQLLFSQSLTSQGGYC